MALLERLYIGGDIVRPHRRQRQPAAVAGEEPGARPRTGASRVRVADVGGKEFAMAPAGSVAGDQRRHQVEFGIGRGCELGRLDDRGELDGSVGGRV
jgi:hypothetical protein